MRGKYKRCYGYVYLLIKDEEIVYIGSTLYKPHPPYGRVAQHKKKDWNYYVAIKSRSCRKKEYDMISFHKPKYNINGLYRGPYVHLTMNRNLVELIERAARINERSLKEEMNQTLKEKYLT